MKSPGFIIGALAVCLVAVVVYLMMRTPSDITPQSGGTSETIAWISLAVAVLSLATAVVGLIQKIVEMRALKGD
jgi:hypothetical protein